MDRCAVLVDAGYLLGGAYTLLTGEKSDRSRLRPDYPPLIEAIRARAEDETGFPVLRIYWYDAAFQRQPTAEHRILRALADVKVRIGNLVLRDEGSPQQKGVDAELHADLVTLARNRAVADVVLVTGDEDLCVAVERAQEYGVRVHAWAVSTPGSGANQSPELVAAADRRQLLDADWVRDHFAVRRDQMPAVSMLPGSARDVAVDSSGPVPGSGTAPGAGSDPEVGDAPPDGDSSEGTVAAAPADAVGTAGPAGTADPAGAAGTAEATGGTTETTEDPLEVGREYGTRWCRRTSVEEGAELDRDRPRIAAPVDRDLLKYAESRGVDTWDSEIAKHAVRDGFWRGVDFVRDIGEAGTDAGP